MEGTTAQSPTSQVVLDGDIFELLGIATMSDDDKAVMLQTMLDTIETRVLARIDDLLSDADVEEWQRIIEVNDPVQNQAFLAKHAIDLPKLYATEALIYKVEIVDLAKRTAN